MIKYTIIPMGYDLMKMSPWLCRVIFTSKVHLPKAPLGAPAGTTATEGSRVGNRWGGPTRDRVEGVPQGHIFHGLEFKPP